MNEELNRFLRGDSAQSGSDQKISGRGDEHFIDFAFQKVSKLALVQGQQGIEVMLQSFCQSLFPLSFPTPFPPL